MEKLIDKERESYGSKRGRSRLLNRTKRVQWKKGTRYIV